jgi:UPF0755 protein
MSETSEDQKSQTKKKKPTSSFRKVSAFLLILAVLGAATAGGMFYWLKQNFTQSWVLQTDKIIEIPSGSGVAKIADILHKQGVIDNPLIFRIMLRLNKADKNLKAGEFLFPAHVTPEKAARILEKGVVVQHQFTIAEGLTSVEILAEINAISGLEDIVIQTPPEGSLLPETYQYTKGMKRADIIKRMQSDMRSTLDELWQKRAEGLPLKSKEEALILASIIEKETGVASERGHVAGVFINRLNKGMRLQTDPTVVYGITLGQEDLGRPLSRKDLKTPTPYNTYTIKGLPPTPICNPGRAAIEAALNPLKTDDLYFVADGTGGHAFAKTLQQHNRNVAKWRKIERAR